MKTILTLILFAWCYLSAYSQSGDSNRFVLAVEKELKIHNKTYIFKSNSCLKIKTENGKIYSSGNYSFSDNYILMDMKDTVFFDDVKWIKGNVHGDAGRKIAGAMIAVCAGISGSAAIVGMMIVGGPIVVVAALTAVPVYGGIRLMGARKFWKMYRCHVVRISQMKS